MSFPITRDIPERSGRLSEIMDEADSVADLLGPLIAGARARGVADACELLGLAAVLIDGTGSVLHAGGRAHRTMNPAVRIAEGHLLGCDARTNEALQGLVASAIDSTAVVPLADEITVRAEGSSCEVTIRALRFPSGIGESQQLLKAILIVSDRQV